jgi:cob(I)alamin adenosyltransferase
MKIYTRTGDDGTTGLIGGRRVGKDDPAIECYGTVDELNASIGLCAVIAQPHLASMLRQVQGELFTIGSHLATVDGDAARVAKLPTIDPAWIDRLETQIDEAEAGMPALRNFILPGGTELAARLHLARTVCRRAERLLVSLSASRTLDPVMVRHLNRLSDWLFVQARRANHDAGHADVSWSGS